VTKDDARTSEARKGAAAICPICGKPTDPRYRPFCSRRCADVDLNRWLKGAYAILPRPVEDEGDADEQRPPVSD
jgi:uncharacterized protein